VALSSPPADVLAKRSGRHFFSVDSELVYWNFYLDFGPLNLAQLYRFCDKLNTILCAEAHRDKKIYFYSSTHAHRRANAVALITMWCVIFKGMTADAAWTPFSRMRPGLPPFHDASPCMCSYHLTVLDCLRGLEKAMMYGFFNFDIFDPEEYEHFETVENGDLNWIVDSKFIAFAGPHELAGVSPDGYRTLTPLDYIPYFRQNNVTLVVRLNKKYYNKQHFVREGIDHADMYYLDGSCPPESILLRFLAKAESTPGAVAVHCKAGLGRTGTCIACYIMKHYRFTAAEAIGWIRICRPGSIIGPQQHYLEEVQAEMWRQGDLYREKHGPMPGYEADIFAEHADDRMQIVKDGGADESSSRERLSQVTSQESSSADFPAPRGKADGVSQGDFLRQRRAASLLGRSRVPDYPSTEFSLQ